MIRIAVTGPESSGKTTLASALAETYNAPLVPEYAREYLTGLNRPYTIEDVELIAREQLRREDKLTHHPLVICDTDLLVLRIWFHHKYNVIPHWLQEHSVTNRYTHHLLTRPDVPYEPDPLRENPDLGDYFFDLFRRELESFGAPYTVVEGSPEERLTTSKKAINNYADGL